MRNPSTNLVLGTRFDKLKLASEKHSRLSLKCIATNDTTVKVHAIYFPSEGKLLLFLVLLGCKAPIVRYWFGEEGLVGLLCTLFGSSFQLLLTFASSRLEDPNHYCLDRKNYNSANSL